MWLNVRVRPILYCPRRELDGLTFSLRSLLVQGLSVAYAATHVRISANVTGDFGNVTDLGLGAGLRG